MEKLNELKVKFFDIDVAIGQLNQQKQQIVDAINTEMARLNAVKKESNNEIVNEK